MTYEVFQIQSPDHPSSFERPTVNRDLTVQFDHIDGNIIGPLKVSSVEVYASRNNQKIEVGALKGVDISCYFTEARMVFVCTKFATGNTYLPGVDYGGSSILEGQL
jgi:hypothetical protein